MLREDRERRNLESLPLVPARLVHGLDRPLYDPGIETRDESVTRLLKVRRPGVDERGAPPWHELLDHCHGSAGEGTA